MTLEGDALAIARAGIRAVDPVRALRATLSVQGSTLRVGKGRFPLGRTGHVWIFAWGKAAVGMARAAEEILGDRVAGGLVAYRKGSPPYRGGRLEALPGSHPIPGDDSRRAAERMLQQVREPAPTDAILYLVSGGGSAILEAPAPGIPFRDLRVLHEHLVGSRLPIQAINAVRKHVSAVKGGRLAAEARARVQVSLAISDVVGDDPATISSGPTVPDPTTYRDAYEALEEAGELGGVPGSVREHLRSGMRGLRPETPKPRDPRLQGSRFLVIASNRHALEGAQREALRRGYRTRILSSTVTGETREVAGVHGAILREMVMFGRPLSPPACLLSGGETTVTLHGRGKGGRNQEFALAAIPAIEGLPEALLMSVGTDGIDGPTDAAGGWVNGESAEGARRKRLSVTDALRNNASYGFLEKLGGLIRLGPTGTNVMDLHILLAGTRARRSVQFSPVEAGGSGAR